MIRVSPIQLRPLSKLRLIADRSLLSSGYVTAFPIGYAVCVIGYFFVRFFGVSAATPIFSASISASTPGSLAG